MNADHRWAETLDSLYDQAWHTLLQGVHDRHSPARHPTLATVSADGWPQARTVVLRAANRSLCSLEIHTNLYSAKIADLQASPRAALHVWDSNARLQIRLLAEVTLRHGADVADAWSAVPPHSRTAYSRSQRPGQPIASALAYDAEPDAAAFAVLQLALCEMDLLHLGATHRRAQFSRSRDWAGQWVAP